MRKRWWAWPCTAVPPHSWIAAAEAHSSVWGGGRTSKRQTRKNNGGKHKWERSLCLLWGSAVVSLCVNLLEVIQFWFPTDLFYDLAKGSCSSLLDSVGEGEGGMICKNGTVTCILSYVKRIASPGSMHDTGCSGLVHWDDPEGWDGEGGGRGVQDGEHMYTHGRVMSMYGKTIL